LSFRRKPESRGEKRIRVKNKMKALSLKQPWAWLVCKGYKDIENRDWTRKFRGRIYIHASLKEDHRPIGLLPIEKWILERLTPVQRDEYHQALKPRGAVIGEVDIIDCVDRSSSPWYLGRYGFILANPVLYEKPIPCKGKLGFFETGINV
jgi:hypothetical protein